MPAILFFNIIDVNFIFIYFWPRGMQSQFLDQGSNLCPLQWEHSLNHQTSNLDAVQCDRQQLVHPEI